MKLRWENLPERAIDHEMIWGGIGLLVIASARFCPFDLLPMPPCPFHSITGYPCLSCGMTRCFILMSHLHIKSAIAMNPLGAAIFLFTFFFTIYAGITVLFSRKRLRVKVTNPIEAQLIRIAVILIALLNWVYLLCVGR